MGRFSGRHIGAFRDGTLSILQSNQEMKENQHEQRKTLKKRMNDTYKI